MKKFEKQIVFSRLLLLLAAFLLLCACNKESPKPGENRPPALTTPSQTAVSESPTPTSKPSVMPSTEPTPFLEFPKPEYALTKETTICYEGNEEQVLDTLEMSAAYTEDGYLLSRNSENCSEEWNYEPVESSGERRLTRYVKTEIDGSGETQTETRAYSYDSNGRILSVDITQTSLSDGTSPNKRELRYNYRADGSGYEAWELGDDGEEKIRYTYENGVCVGIRIANGQEYRYDAMGHVIEVTYAGGEVQYQAVYSEKWELLRAYQCETNDSTEDTTYFVTTYEATYKEGKLQTETVRKEYAAERTEDFIRTYLYDEDGTLMQVLRTDAGKTEAWVEFQYSEQMEEDVRVVRELEYGNSSVHESRVCWYDKNGVLLEEFGKDDVKRAYTYGASGERLTVSYVASGENVWEEYRYNEYGLPETKTCLKYSDGVINSKTVTTYEYAFFDALPVQEPVELGYPYSGVYIETGILYRHLNERIR